MADISVTALKVSPLKGAITRDFTAGGSGSVGNLVYIDGANGAKQADGSAAGTAEARGIVVAVEGGKTTFVSGDRLTVVILGPVAGFAGMTPGALHYASDTAGALADAAGTATKCVGFAESATVFCVYLDLFGELDTVSAG